MLLNLLRHASEITNISNRSSEERAQLLLYINRAGEELYNSHDIPGAMREQYFTIVASTQLITLPWYVHLIRGIRRATYSSKIQLVDMRPRYHYRPWRQQTLQWRLLGDRPLEQNMTDNGRLTLSLQGAETESLSVTILGQTTQAAMTKEVVTFEPGQTQVTTTNQFTTETPTGVRSIVKSRTTTYDLVVTQELDGRQIATIPNSQLQSLNQVIQVHDGNYSLIYSGNELVEILYKLPYEQLVEDADLFIDTGKYDDALIWKMREQWYSTKEGGAEQSILAKAKCEELMQKLCGNIEESVEKTMTFAEDGIEFAPRHTYRFARYGQIQ